MWKYNETNNLPSTEIYNSADELYHYGVLGMRWHNRRMRMQKYNNDLVKSRREKATQHVLDLKNKHANINKIEKAKIKADKIKRSKYGQTRGQILGKGILRQLGSGIIGGTAYKMASHAGKEKTARTIAALTSGYQTVNALKTGYKLFTAYDKPTKKSGTRMSYK